MPKPFISIRLFGGYNTLRRKLIELGVSYREHPFLSNFWGIEFQIDKPYGKGSRETIKVLRRLQDPVTYRKAVA